MKIADCSDERLVEHFLNMGVNSKYRHAVDHGSAEEKNAALDQARAWISGARASIIESVQFGDSALAKEISSAQIA